MTDPARRDAGSRGISGVLRHPVVSLTAPFRAGLRARPADRAAAASDKGVAVTCFLRASFEPFPRALRRGVLRLDASGARWRDHALPSDLAVALVRDVEGREGLHAKPHFFRVIDATSARGTIALAVPKDSVDLVTGWFSRRD